MHFQLQGKASRDGCDAVRRVCATVRMVARWGGGSRIEQLGRIWRFGGDFRGDLETAWRAGGERERCYRSQLNLLVVSLVYTERCSFAVMSLAMSLLVLCCIECTWTGKLIM
jgi:hypothetical protein